MIKEKQANKGKTADKKKQAEKKDKPIKVKPAAPKKQAVKAKPLAKENKSGKDKQASKEKLPVPDLFINRELSWLDFNDRVLDESRDKDNPLLERVKFLAITSSNLDEFFMIRVASLKDLTHAGYEGTDPAGMTAEAQLSAISEKTHTLVRKQYSTYNRVLYPELVKNGIRILKFKDLSGAQERYLDHYFRQTVFPVLTPLAVDAGRPFPLISNRSLNLCCLVNPGQTQAQQPPKLAVVQVPSVMPRLVAVPSDDHTDFILLEDLVRRHLPELFRGAEILTSGAFRIMRNADLDIEDEGAADLLKEIEKQVRLRQWGEVIRLETESDIDETLLDRLKASMNLNEEDLYLINGPLDLTFLFRLSGIPGYPQLRFAPFEPPVNEALMADPFAAIRTQDRLLHHPYHAFDPVTELIRCAAKDPDVLAIKQTLYRVSGNSPIVKSLEEAAERGKQVLVLVELKARFDEENNIQWARRLEQAGCHVIYGLVGLKVHSKITLIAREEEHGIRRYVHLGTGNYNDQTARIYSDYSLFTCSESIGEDATEFFNMLSGYSAPLSWRRLIVAPFWLRREVTRLIEQEIRHAKEGKPARIVIKVNSLVDPDMISLLYRASNAGVDISLIVRGICCLRAGVPGLSERITVRSLIGRFLEHSRIYLFHNDGQDDLFLSSADLMERNLDRRVELFFPVEDPKAYDQILEFLALQLNDTNRARLMDEHGDYQSIDRRGKQQIDSQAELIRQSLRLMRDQQQSSSEIRFTPAESEWEKPDLS